MKNVVKILALTMALVLVAGVLASCGGGLSGTYKSHEIAGSFTSYEFSGSKVTIKVFVVSQKVYETEGKYSIDGDEITFEFASDDKESDKKYSGTQTFSKDGDTIKIGGVSYTKSEK